MDINTIISYRRNTMAILEKHIFICNGCLKPCAMDTLETKLPLKCFDTPITWIKTWDKILKR